MPDLLPDRPLRTWLFVPGAAQRYMAKLRSAPSVDAGKSGSPEPAAQARPDVIVLDLEDAVAADERDAARERVAGVLRAEAGAFVAPICVRTHSASDPAFEDDLAALGPGLAALVLPKVLGAGEVRHAAERLERVGLGTAGLVVMVESAAGLRDIDAILAAHPSVRAVAFGAEDMAADLGLPPGGVGPEADAARRGVLDTVRATLVVAASAAGIRRRIDSPTLQLRDLRQVEDDARRARAMGFDAKFAIHPSHLDALRRGFSPNASEVAWARKVLTVAGMGAVASGGKMVDEAVVRQARDVLAEAEETAS
ncbi:MAG: CoA ester lyase [Trueperaceae bacterium]